MLLVPGTRLKDRHTGEIVTLNKVSKTKDGEYFEFEFQERTIGDFLFEKDNIYKYYEIIDKAPIESTGGTKHDEGKPRLDLLPSGPLVEIARALEFGSRKYGDNQWRNGFAWSRLYGASLRHLLAHKDGESLDPESKISHLAHAACNLLFLNCIS